MDPIADMLTRIRNANQALLPEVQMSHSNMRESIAKILKKEGYIGEVAVEGKPGAKTITSAVRGLFKTNESSRAEAMALIHQR